MMNTHQEERNTDNMFTDEALKKRANDKVEPSE